MAKSRLHIELLGHFRLLYDGTPVNGISSARQQSLLAYLVLHRNQPQLRQQIAAVFWPDSPDEQSLTNLRRELHHLRQNLPEADSFLLVDGKELSWNPQAAFSLDVAQFEQICGQADVSREVLEGTLQRYDELLPRCHDDWITSERERLHRKCLQAHERLVELLEQQREYPQAIEKTRHLVQLEPLHEAAYRTLMRLCSLQGERAAALHAYHSCVSVLERELGSKPSPATQALYQSLIESSDLPSLGKPIQSLPAGTFPLVGRQKEWDVLQQAFVQAALGNAMCVFVQGEAGIGKTRLVEELLVWCRERSVTAARARCYAAEGRLAFAPVAEWLRSENLRTDLASMNPIWLSAVARLLPELSNQYPNLQHPQALGENWQRRAFFEALVQFMLSDHEPLLLVLDDIQWCDPDTLEWLHYLLRFDIKSRLLVVCTLRSEESQDNPALQLLVRDLRQLGQLNKIELGPLDESQTAELAAWVAEQHPNDQISAELFRQTEGHPLFVVEMVRNGLTEFAAESFLGNHLPPKVQAVIATRLARLSPQARDLVELAAVIGRDFDYEVLREASDLDEKNLVQALDELWQRRIIREQGAFSYDFSHDRLREVSSSEVSPMRRRLLHRRVAQALELLHVENFDAVCAQLAFHHERAGQTTRAIQFYRQAALVAQQVSANEEAIRSLSKALDLLKQTPATLERDRQELWLQKALSLPLMVARGYSSPKVEAAVTRMGELARRLGEFEALNESVLGLQGVHYVRGNIRKSLDLAFEARRLAEEHPGWIPNSEWAIGGCSLSIGALTQSRTYLERAIAGYDPQHPSNTVLGPDLAVFSYSWAAHGLWLLGYPDQALNYHHSAVKLAQTLQNPFDLTLAYAYGAILYQMLQDPEQVRTCSQMVLELCAKYDFVYYRDWALILSGWTDRDATGSVRIRQGLDNLQALQAGARLPYYLGLLAETHLQIGQPKQARPILDAALSTAAQNEDLWWNAELHRLRGELFASEESFGTALKIAREQESKSLELRSAISLARLWQTQGRSREALELLEPILGWFKEGFDTHDLRQAQTLIQTLCA